MKGATTHDIRHGDRWAQGSTKAFTLVELMISISIFTIITAVAMYNHNQFDGTVLLTNLSYEIALSVREAQSYGIAVKQDVAQDFNAGYGIHFDTLSPASYILFEDEQSSTKHIYDNLDTALQTFKISKGNKVSKVCVDGDCTHSVVDVSFIRPNPDAYITAGGSAATDYSEADICIASPQGTHRLVTVYITGQISVDTDITGKCN